MKVHINNRIDAEYEWLKPYDYEKFENGKVYECKTLEEVEQLLDEANNISFNDDPSHDDCYIYVEFYLRGGNFYIFIEDRYIY